MARRGQTALPPGSLRPSAVPRSRQVRHGLWSRARRSARHMPSRAHARPAPPFAGSLSRSPCPLSPLRPFPIPPIRPYSESEGLTTRSLDECARGSADLRRLCTPRGSVRLSAARNRASCVTEKRRIARPCTFSRLVRCREVRRARAPHAIGRRALRMGDGWMHEASLRAIRSDRPMMTNAPGPKTCSAPSPGRGRAGMVGRGGARGRAGGGRTRMGTGANGDGRTRIDARASAAVRSPALRLRPPPVVRFVNEISVLDKSQKFRHYIPRT